MVFAGTLTWYHTQKNTQFTQGPLDWHTYIHIYLHHLLRAHNSYLYCTELITCWSKIYFRKFHSVFAYQNYSIVEVIYMVVWLNKTKPFLWNTTNTDRKTNNTDIKDVNEQKTHKTHKLFGASDYESNCMHSGTRNFNHFARINFTGWRKNPRHQLTFFI